MKQPARDVQRHAETRTMIETYGKQVRFPDDTALLVLANSIE